MTSVRDSAKPEERPQAGGELADVELGPLFSDNDEDYDPSPQSSGRVVKSAPS